MPTFARQDKTRRITTDKDEKKKTKRYIETIEASDRAWLDKHKFSYDDHGIYCYAKKEGIGTFSTALISTKYLLNIKI